MLQKTGTTNYGGKGVPSKTTYFLYSLVFMCLPILGSSDL